MRVRAVVTTLGIDAGEEVNVLGDDVRVRQAIAMGFLKPLEPLEGAESAPLGETTQESPQDAPAAVEGAQGPLVDSQEQGSSEAQ